MKYLRAIFTLGQWTVVANAGIDFCAYGSPLGFWTFFKRPARQQATPHVVPEAVLPCRELGQGLD